MNTSQDFTKYVSSTPKLRSFLKTLLIEGERIDFTSTCKGKRKLLSYGEQKTFNWVYEHFTKKLSVAYTDGRPKPDSKSPKFFIIWIEGLSPKNGDKVKAFKDDGIEYTSKMTEAMRVTPKDVSKVLDKLKENNVAKWVLNDCFVGVNYAPKNTIYKP